MMAAGAEWSKIIKPFVTPCDGSKADIIELCSAIVKRESEILHHKENSKTFYNSFAVLAANCISSNATLLSASQLELVSAACRVLLKYLIGVLQTVSSDSTPSTAQASRYLNAIRSLCLGISLLSESEQAIITASMKGETLPNSNVNQTGNESAVKAETTKARCDLSVTIFEQLTLPYRDGRIIDRPPTPDRTSSQDATTGSSDNSSDPSTEINKLFLSANTESLQSLRAGDTLVDLCLSLQSLKRAKSKCDEALAGKHFSLPSTHSEAAATRNSLPSMLSDISLAMSAISLPVLEPLTPSKLDKLSALCMAGLHCAISQAAASSILGMGSAISPKCTQAQSQTSLKDDDLENTAVSLVEEAIAMFDYVGTTIKNSTRAGGHVYQNHLLAGAWVLVSGLQTYLAVSAALITDKGPHAREDKGRSPSKSREANSARTSLMKFQQGFGVLSVALATKALQLLSDLMDDLHIEINGGGYAASAVTTTAQVDPAPLTMMGQFTALQRVARVLAAAPLNTLLFYLATVSYRKACALKRIQKHPTAMAAMDGADTFSQSDSTTYYEDEDMIMCSGESSTDEDDDSEPILGQWFEETLAPPETTSNNENSTNSDNQDVNKPLQSDRNASVVPEKGEPHGYISLATQIFVFMNKHFLSSKCSYVMTRYVEAGLQEQQMGILAAIIRDLDRETARTETGTISVYFGTALSQLYSEFSGALTRYTHNLVTHSALSSLQATLLGQLGVSPWNTDEPHSWPLQVYPRTLAVLAQVLLLRPQNEKEASIISIWHRLVNTLVENVINPPTQIDLENEDLNVEHAQVLLYLFHSLNLMQKKSVLLLMAGGVVRCSEVARGNLRDSQLLHLSRLLLMLDYIMKNLYDAPSVLLEHMQWNLFYSTNFLSSPASQAATSNNTTTSENANGNNKSQQQSRMYVPWPEIEDNYRKHLSSGGGGGANGGSGGGQSDDFHMKPRFYAITTSEINNQETPKLDGLACNFVLGTPDKLRYPLLLDALIEILNVTNVSGNNGKLTFQGLCATQYCFTICWKLLLLLPPSTSYMEQLATGETLPAGPLLLHTLVWAPRAGHKTFSRWMRDGLIKQGMYTAHAETLVKAVADVVSSLKYDVNVAKSCISALTPDVKKGTPVTKESLPPLWHLFLLDAIFAKVQVALIEDTEVPNSTSGSTTDCATVVSAASLVQDLLPHVLRMTQAILHCTRWTLLHNMVEQCGGDLQQKATSLHDYEGLHDILAICSGKNSLTSSLAPELNGLLPSGVSGVLQQWNTSGGAMEDCTWTPYLNDIFPAESYIIKIIDTHVATLSSQQCYTIKTSLKRVLQCLIKFVCQHAPRTDNTDTKNKAIELLVQVTLDARTEFLHDTVSKTIDKMIGDAETLEHQKRVYCFVLEHTYQLIINYTSSTANYGAFIEEKVLHNLLKFMEKLLEKSSGRQALENFFVGDSVDLVKVLMSVSNPQMSQNYGTRVLHFFNKLFQAAEKSPADPSLNYLCSSMSKLAQVESEKLQTWLRHVILGPCNMISSATSSANAQTITTAIKPAAVDDNGTSNGKSATENNGSMKPSNSGKTEQWTIVQVSSAESPASPSPSDDHKSLVQENSQLLQALTTFIVKPNSNVSEDVAVIILKALLPLGSHILSPALEGVGFPDLLVVMATLADAGTGRGHSYLFPATADWLDIWQHINPKHQLMLESSCYLLNYVGDVLNALIPGTQGCPGVSARALSPPWEGEAPIDVDSSDWPEEQGEDEDSGEDSDEDSLCNKLCTFTITQKEFMNQHWYHCHTCRMLDGVGVCSVCARVCHRGHDLSYAKYGNFFCDCGAKEDGSCQALVKRSPQSADGLLPGGVHGTSGVGAVTVGGYGVEHMLTSSLRRRPSSPIPIDRASISRDKNRLRSCAKQIEGSREFLLNYLSGCPMLGGLLEMVQNLIPSVEQLCEKNSPVGCHARAQLALRELHGGDKKCINTDQLVMPRLGSQEGAFENVRMVYAGEQGQTIRQLLSAHIVRRVAMCCMTSPHSKRQHLAVSHEKGKITVLQLSALLKQADSSTRKLTLNRLASAPIPYTVLSLSGNTCNEDYLAVCGLKDCHVLTFNSTGSVSDHLVLHPQLETGNFIIKAIWLPGSQTKLALVTADFVKVYDLSKDPLSPQYYFLVPSGKIRDCTFIYKEGVYTILLMSSPGHIYKETLNEESSAKHGSFYVTNTLEVFYLDVTDVNGQVSGGGVSIYYSHTLSLLFFSYAQGKSFIAPLKPRDSCLTLVFPISLPTPKSNGSKNSSPQPLCQWTEIPNHPGLICCVMQASNNPVILMLKPDSISVQEIKVVPSKSKIMDMVAIRHSSGSENRTTIILLCEDGSLKIYVANMDQTGFWMSPSIQPVLAQPGSVKSAPSRKKKAIKSGGGGAGGKTSGSLSFPVDFFEHCQPMNDVEIGGHDLLQVYNLGQLKNRLNTTGMYVVCTKPLGFSVDVVNSDNNLVMTGIRVLLGNQDVQRTPSFIEVFGRIVTTSVSRNRWYDIPFSREESLQADKKVTVMFGPSHDPEIVTMIDSIKVYGKTKEAFGWPEESEETANANVQSSVNAQQSNGSSSDQENMCSNPTPLSLLERFVCGALEVLDGSFCLCTCCSAADKCSTGGFWPEDKLQMYKTRSVDVATKFLTLPTQPPLQMHAKSLLAALHTTKGQYHNYKDQALLSHVFASLSAMRDLENKKVTDVDAESYYRLVLIVRGIAVTRPQNLIKFAEQNSQLHEVALDDPIDLKNKTVNKAYPKNQHLIIQLMDVLWLLHSANPDNCFLAPVVVPGLKHVEQVVHALVEIVHAFNTSDAYANLTFTVYLQLLLCEDPLIAFSARQALCRVLKPKGRRRRVFIPSPPHCVTPPEKGGGASSSGAQESEENKRPARASQQSSQEDDGSGQVARSSRYAEVDAVEAIAMLQQHVAENNEAGNHNVNPLEALLGGAAGFPPLLDIPPDADDETMVELAIALSLQEHELGPEMQNLQQGLVGHAGQALHSLQVLANQGLGQAVGGGAQVQEAGHYSDTTASAGGSDDEGSTAATDGSTLRTSPAEQGGSAGSESGGSGVDSITGEHNVSGRSSAYGDHIQEAVALVGRSETSSVTNANYQQTETDGTVAPDHETDVETESSGKLQVLRLQLLEHLVEFLPRLREVDGVRAIPFMQVVLALANDLDGSSERDRNCLESLLKAVVAELQITNLDTKNIQTRSKFREVQLVLMRFLGVLTNRKPTATGGASGSGSKTSTVTDNFVSQTAATELHKAQIINHCLKLLESMLDYWRNLSVEESNGQIGGALLKEHLPHSPPDMQPFFLRQYVKGHATDVFEGYAQLLTEMALRLPYQVHKHSDLNQSVTEAFESTWFWYLCEYMMYTQTPFVRRQVRKLLLYICGNKEKYRQLRDLHTLESHVFAVQQCCIKGGYDSKLEVQHALSLPYDTLVELVEHLKACLEVANSRTGNWQHYCLKHTNTLSFLLQVSCLLDEGVSPTILNLLHCAIVNYGGGAVSSGAGGGSGGKKTDPTSKPVLPRKDREKSDDSATTESAFEEANCVQLVEQITTQVPQEVLASLIKNFLLETNATNVRWQAHALILAIYRNSQPANQEMLLKLLWHLWPLLPAYGRKAAQFVDLLGYFSLRYSENDQSSPIVEYVEKAVEVLQAQNELLAHHPNASLYASMAQFVELDGYYLESEPCLVCNNPEVPLATIKLTSVRVDSKFTTTTQIVKLLSSHTISKISLRIGDLKRTKMVRTINIFYNNRNVQAVVELKNKPALWHKAKKVTLQSGQTEVKIEFPLAIVACNLMIEYADFYENIQASSETLQCPRCSAAVPANPGVCANCGENVFQCHKCRAINYDEKDPFLCHACGFCKYAKFDYSLVARPCCAVESIENDDDRKKMVASINSLLEKADRVYKQLMGKKPTLESLLVKICEHRTDEKSEESSPTTTSGSSGGGGMQVNKTIQMLAQQYCTECKTSFEELSKIIQKVLVSRKELVAYDRKHRDAGPSRLSFPILNTDSKNATQERQPTPSQMHSVTNRCYGCSSAATEHCLTLLRALATNPLTRHLLHIRGLIQELVWNNLRKGSVQTQEQVQQLLCILTRDNAEATEQLCSLLMERITNGLNGHVQGSDLGMSVRHEINLLSVLVQKEDECWEMKLRCMMQLFLLACEDSRSPLIMASIILPCLKILQGLMKPGQSASPPGSGSAQSGSSDTLPEAKTGADVEVDVYRWLRKDGEQTFFNWLTRAPLRRDTVSKPLPKSREEIRAFYLTEKYGNRWRHKVQKMYGRSAGNGGVFGGGLPPELDDTAWLKTVLFNPSSRHARQVACNILECMCSTRERKKEVLLLLTCYLEELSMAGESAAEFLQLYQALIQETPWKQFLAIQGVLTILADLITQEIEQLHRLEETTLTSDLAQGYALNQFTELLASFLDDKAIRRQYKGRLVGAVLNGYLSLKSLVVQRTRLIDDTQEKLLELLEEMTTGTEEETKAFMAVCIETVNKYSIHDVLTPVFIFERLCSIIYPEENDIGEFFLTLEKDPQQEEFLQGRMLGNPYSSLEAGLGPLMRDVKNKICMDCELVALLEDDNGMELLVNNKIMSLDLAVKEVYKKVWLAEGGEGDSMRIVYRMRGLLGDATEEFIETLNAKAQETIDNELVYKMANVLADCGGLKIMVQRLDAITSVWRARPLLQVLLKLFRLSVKVTKVQEVLIQVEIGATSVFLKTLQLCLNSDSALTEQLLDIMETVLSRATSKSMEEFKVFSQTFGGPEYIRTLLGCMNSSNVRNNSSVLVHLTRVLAALVYGNEEKMEILINYFKPALNFNDFDCSHSSEDVQKLEMFCVLTTGIEKNSIGNTLKDYIISLHIVREALDYITIHAPCVKPTLLRTDSDELKEFISKPALKYILRFLTGLASEHENTQHAVSEADTIPIIHRLEQVSSDEHVGSLAENLLEALKTNEAVASRIEEVREFTRSEKKRLAMAMREKQLGALGMRTNDKGQVTAKSAILQQMEELGEETGLVCCICREGYKYQPAKVLGIYTFTKRCNIEDYECKQRKTVGYTTVTHFNVVHVDCHMSAVRLARARDEWESAALQNANTKCNGLLPLWGPQVPESAFASCLARHNTYLQESTNHRDIGYMSTVHDVKLLLLRFSQEKTFHDDTGGGGPQSNMHLIPYLIHMALYVINTTRIAKREESNLTSYLEQTAMDRWVESSYETEGPLYWIIMSVLLHSPQKWSANRVAHLRRIIIVGHTRHVHPAGPVKALSDKNVQDYGVYKPFLLFYGLIDGIYNNFFKSVPGAEENWSTNLADYIRHNDEALLKASERLLSTYMDELLPCASFEEFCDVHGLLNSISNADTYISDLLKGV